MDGDTVVTTMLLSRLHYPVTSLGFGRRAGIWVQGCTVHCRGCVSRDTWPADEAMRVEIDSVLDWLRELDDVDGITVSGGEPTDQPDALRILLNGIEMWRATRANDVDVLLYSGRTTDELAQSLPWLSKAVDVVVSGPYIRELASDSALRGSSNQVVEVCSKLGAMRYPAESREETYADQRREIGVHVDEHTIWMVGIPLQNDMTRLRGALADRGVTLDRTSWLS
ncbi:MULTISPECIES: 4Fe-4S single cluster domain-containing protein [Rhodococcus]|uniref:4Fe-4S single cluster domain-containing protein n=1 Tax=Rhodococcus TaxID=1827 RepID=UPI0005D42408|nr:MULTISPECIES: 4Fe-4S single cluster domain-containing protein [Rhodococcus]KJF24929.1 anaerobic ribonucleotide reductase-activating protein [Rhodococcus sp. AD45]